MRKIEVNEKVYEEINTMEDQRKRNYSIISINRFKEGVYIDKRDKTSNRYYSNLTSLNKNLRKYLSYESKQLVNIDIKNSQPFFSLMLLHVDFWQDDNKLIKQYFNTNQINGKKFATISQLYRLAKKIPVEESNDYREKILSGKIYEFFLENVNRVFEKNNEIKLNRDEI